MQPSAGGKHLWDTPKNQVLPMEVPAELAEVSKWGVSSLYLYGKLVDENGPFVDDLIILIYLLLMVLVRSYV